MQVLSPSQRIFPTRIPGPVTIQYVNDPDEKARRSINFPSATLQGGFSVTGSAPNYLTVDSRVGELFKSIIFMLTVKCQNKTY